MPSIASQYYHLLQIHALAAEAHMCACTSAVLTQMQHKLVNLPVHDHSSARIKGHPLYSL